MSPVDTEIRGLWEMERCCREMAAGRLHRGREKQDKQDEAPLWLSWKKFCIDSFPFAVVIHEHRHLLNTVQHADKYYSAEQGWGSLWHVGRIRPASQLDSVPKTIQKKQLRNVKFSHGSGFFYWIKKPKQIKQTHTSVACHRLQVDAEFNGFRSPTIMQKLFLLKSKTSQGSCRERAHLEVAYLTWAMWNWICSKDRCACVALLSVHKITQENPLSSNS